MLSERFRAAGDHRHRLDRAGDGRTCGHGFARRGDGGLEFVKVFAEPPSDDAFSTEAEGLVALRTLGPVLIPEVLLAAARRAQDGDHKHVSTRLPHPGGGTEARRSATGHSPGPTRHRRMGKRHQFSLLRDEAVLPWDPGSRDRRCVSEGHADDDGDQDAPDDHVLAPSRRGPRAGAIRNSAYAAQEPRGVASVAGCPRFGRTADAIQLTGWPG